MYTAALESFGCHVHRQMIIRMLHIEPLQIGAVLDRLSGILFESEDFSVAGERGIFHWATRHLLIAETISKFKLADSEARFRLLNDVVNNLNPFQRVEKKTISSMCNANGGIESLRSVEKRIEIYRRLTEIAPREKLPWHRLLAVLIAEERVDEAERTIQRSREFFNNDSTVQRRRIELEILKSKKFSDLPDNDRRAIAIAAREEAERLCERRPDNKYVYETLIQAELALMEWTNDPAGVQVSLDRMYHAFERLLDPWLEKRHRHYEGMLRARFRPA